MTESQLRHWRKGSTYAERLCAQLLIVEGYQSVDPQRPLGGPDGLKDIVCKKDGRKWLAACYFPNETKPFKEVRDKFRHDAHGVLQNGADGIVFFTNQSITPSQRAELAESVLGNVELYHLERLRALIDSPTCLGLRLEYLGIPLSQEDQLSFFATFGREISRKIEAQGQTLASIQTKLDEFAYRTMARAHPLTEPSALQINQTAKLERLPTSVLTIGLLLWVHHLVRPPSERSRASILRNEEVWIGRPGVGKEGAALVPPAPLAVPHLLSTLLEGWRADFSLLKKADADEIIDRVANFHHQLLAIHPFPDGNGAVARELLRQQFLDLIGLPFEVTGYLATHKTNYYEALNAADRGDLGLLRKFLTDLIAWNIQTYFKAWEEKK